MSVAWTTILVIALLLPGVFFFIGYAIGERFTREIIKTSAIGEIGGAVLIALVIHLLAWAVLSVFGFSLADTIDRVADYDAMPKRLLIDRGIHRAVYFGLYTVVTALAGLAAGWGFRLLISQEFFSFLATHKWLNKVQLAMKSGLVTAFVMTTVKENHRVLMYRGILAEFYLSPEGKFIYLVLKSCSRFFMKFENDELTTSTQLQLFHQERSDRSWEYLLIDGSNISNVLFDPSPQIVETPAGEKALENALKELTAAQQSITRTAEQFADMARTHANQENAE